MNAAPLRHSMLADLRADSISPVWSAEGPTCSESCPQHDGKRCMAIGFSPGRYCEPAVAAMARVLEVTP